MSVEEAAVQTDATCARLLDALRAELGDQLLGAEIQGRELVVRVHRDVWDDAARACKRKLGMDYFCFLSGLDWLDNPTQTSRYENIWGTVEDEEPGEGAEPGEPAEPEAAAEAEAGAGAGADEALVPTGLAGGETRFQVFARFFSTREHRGITVKADLDDAAPSVPTISKIYAGADWHERETSEMFGFDFPGHPHLVHIYLPTGFEGHPLRKDFPLLAREVKPWPGLTNVEPITGDADAEGSEG